jgi:putative oxidoreductase
MNTSAAAIATFGRLLIAVIFLFSGTSKILAPSMTQAYIASAGLPFPIAAYFIAIAIEIGGGILLVLGFKARLIALAVAIFSVATAIGFHHNFADPDQLMHFLKNISMAGGLLQVTAFGGGAFCIDALGVPREMTLRAASLHVVDDASRARTPQRASVSHDA